jgi:lambda family phage portal protein
MTIGYVPDWLPKGTPPAAPAAPKVVAPPRRPRGRTATYDAAQTNTENTRHWSAADNYSAAAANSRDVREKLRTRSRYECANSSYLGGVVQTIAYDTIGSGPRLQLGFAPGAGDPKALYPLARQVERLYAGWQRATGYADKLRVLFGAKVVDGEGFGVMTTNPMVPDPVKLDLGLIECDRVCDPVWAVAPTPGDGITYDAAGNPVSYKVLRDHPGDLAFPFPTAAGRGYDVVPARFVLHWFRATRPGQLRGVPETAAALPLGAELRRYTRATILAAELAASLAGVLSTEQGVPGDEAPEFETFDTVEVSPGMLVTLPAGWSASQFKGEQPVAEYASFKHEILNEMGRGLHAPFNVTTGNSSGYNYSSSRLDLQMYQRFTWANREMIRHKGQDRMFLAWVAEAGAVGLLPDGMPPADLWAWDWHWDAFTSVDPQKDAAADAAELALGLTTRAEKCAARGIDWRETIDQLAAEQEYAASMGVVFGNPAAGAAAPAEPEPPPPPRPSARPPSRNGARRDPARG